MESKILPQLNLPHAETFSYNAISQNRNVKSHNVSEMY